MVCSRAPFEKVRVLLDIRIALIGATARSLAQTLELHHLICPAHVVEKLH